MSAESWRKEYYPIKAYLVPPEKALDHSIRKWEGLLPEALKAHEVEITGTKLASGATYFTSVAGILVDAGTCALCFHYLRENCSCCPLARVRFGVRCDERRTLEKESPYRAFSRSADPKPMLKWLLRAKQAVETGVIKIYPGNRADGVRAADEEGDLL